jgi:maleylpyruvate isomerase
MITLYDYYRSSACYRVRIALNLKNLGFDTIPVHLVNNGGEQFSEQYQKINPQTLVPSLDIGNQIITQSLAIIEYLDEVHPQPALLPIDPVKRALVRSFALTIAADIHPLNNLRVLKYLQGTLHISDEQKNDWYQNWIQKGFVALEAQLAANNDGAPFCFGDTASLADICLIPQMYNARRFNTDLSPYPTLRRIDTHCQEIAAFSLARPVETA